MTAWGNHHDLSVPPRFADSPLLDRLIFKFARMTGDLIACSDHESGLILMRRDASERELRAACRREIRSVLEHWTGGDRKADVIPLWRPDGLG